ncbi:MAG: tRNA (adenosine(37)-N6)-dimethylallyltransferase MiaA [Maribacter sp.]
MSKTLISIIGPTAIGKTKLAIALAQHFNTDIISADSRQFFKEMRIGTAVPNNEELEAAPHHFIQHRSIQEPYTVGDFEREALEKLNQLFVKNDIVIMVGGSGLYVDAVTDGLNIFPRIDPSVRENLNRDLTQKGLRYLQAKLKELDPDYYKKVDIQNPQRVIRALEVSVGSGKPYSSFLNKPKNKRPFKVLTIGLKAEREIIYSRINQRVDQMVNEGLLDEVKELVPFKELNALQTVGYKELFNYYEGEWTLDFAISEIKKNTRRFAKRQLTWFLKRENASWFEYNEDLSSLIRVIEEQLKNSK